MRLNIFNHTHSGIYMKEYLALRRGGKWTNCPGQGHYYYYDKVTRLSFKRQSLHRWNPYIMRKMRRVKWELGINMVDYWGRRRGIGLTVRFRVSMRDINERERGKM